MSNDTEIPAVYEGYWLPRNTVLHGRYEIRDVIAEGGMGIVYLGYDPVLETKVSIKEYFPRRYAMRIPEEVSLQIYAGSSAEIFRTELDKFIKEARTLARFGALDSIVSVKDFFYENETGYMVMEYVEGETVKQLVPEESVRRILHDRVVPLSQYRDIDLPDSAKKAIEKGMAVDIQKRYADVELLCKDLYQNVDIVNGELQKSKANSLHMSRWSLIGILLLLVIGAGIYGSGIMKRTNHNNAKDGTTGANIVNTAAVTVTPTTTLLSTLTPSDAIPATKQPSGRKTPEKAGASEKPAKARKAGVTATTKPAALSSSAPDRKKSSSPKTGSSNQKSFAGKLPKATKESFAGQLP